MRLLSSVVQPNALSVFWGPVDLIGAVLENSAAERGEDLVVERHGKAVAAVVSMAHLESIEELESDLRESVLLLSRLVTDTGDRTDLDQVISAFGLDRAELEAELEADLTSGCD